MNWWSKESQAPVKLKRAQLSARIERTMMVVNRKGFSTVSFVMAILLICCNPTSAFVNQTTVQQPVQQPTSHKGWSYFFEHPIPANVPPNKQFGVQDEENLSGQQVIKQSAIPIGSAPAPQCGKGPNLQMYERSLISEKIGGESSAATSPWPFLVNLRKSTDPPGVYFCSGSLITDMHVLLAAQCLEKLANCEILCVTVLVGQSNKYGPSVAMTRTISKYLIHSAYNPLTYANDIALIKLNMPVIFSRSVGPVCLPPASTDPDEYIDRLGVIMGWGPETQGDPSTVLKHGVIFIASTYDCMAATPFVSSLNICIIPAWDTLMFTCMADVGGPVVTNMHTYWSPNLPPIWTQIGINSYTKDCRSFGLKTRVSAFRGWIDQTIGPSGYLA